MFTSAGNKWSRAQYVSLQPEPTGSRRWFPGDKHRAKTNLQKNSFCFKIIIYINVISCIKCRFNNDLFKNDIDKTDDNVSITK